MDVLHSGLAPVLWGTNAFLIVLAIALAAALIQMRREITRLRASESRLRFALRVSDIGVFDHDHCTGEIYRSPEFCGLYGLTADGSVNNGDFLQGAHLEDRDAVAQAIERAHDPQGQGLFDVQHRVVLPDGAVRWLALRSLTLFEGEGASRHAVRTVGTATDFTARKRVDEALQQVIRISRIGIYDHDQENDRIYWSPEQRQNYGFSADEPVTLEKFLECVFPDDRAAIAIAIQRAHDPSGDGLFDAEHRIIRRDGQVRWLLTRSQTFFSPEGYGRRAVRTIGAVLDVTDRRNSEEQLRQREQIHSAVVSQSTDGIALVDTATLQFVEFNDAACGMLGYPRDVFESLTLPELAPDAVTADRVRAQIAASLHGGGDLGLTKLRRRDGSLLPVWLTGRPVTHHNRVDLAIVWRDTTERGKVDRRNRLLASLVRHSKDFVGVAGLDSRAAFINDSGRRLIGLGPVEGLQGRKIPDFVHPRHEDKLLREVMPTLIATGRWSGELDLLRLTDGAPIPTLTETFRIDDINGEPMCLASVSHDITDIKQADAELRRLNSIHRTLSHTQHLIVRAGTEVELLARICDIAVEDAGFALVWIGLLNPDGFLRAGAVAGPARAYIDGLKLTVDERLPEGRGPAGRALRSGAHIIVNDIESSEIMRPWLDRVHKFGIKSSAAFPLFRSDRVTGIMSVHSTVRDHFGEREISLLDDMAADISFGLESLDRTAALESSRELIRDIEATVRIGSFRLMLPEGSLWWSEGTPAVLGLPATTSADRHALEAAFEPEIVLMLIVALDDAAQAGNPIDIDLPLRVGPLARRWIRLFGVPKRRDDGKTEISGTLQDISERKRLEAEVMAAADTERRRLASELHDNLGQILYGTSLLLAAIAREAKASESALSDKIDQTTSAMNEAMQVCRTLAHGAAPIVDGGLSAALRELAARTAVTGVRCIAVTSDAVNAVIPGAPALELYRIAQEAVTNALKHAQCRSIEIQLALRATAVELLIHDDGAGLELRGAGGEEGIGLRTMRYRAARAGGTLELRSSRGHGTIVRVLVPFLAEEAAPRTVSTRD
jgi:PAS domain S-box-containing protein